MAAHDDIHRLAMLARDVVDRIPERPLPGSPRQTETRELRSTSGGGGVARAELLDKLNVEMQVMIGHLTLVVGGVSDALDIAAQRDNQVNGPALAYIVRPALELAGQVAWLLTDQIGAEQRARRHLVWRLADLRAQRLLMRDFRAWQDQVDAAAKELDEDEDEILAAVAAARWAAQPTTYNGPHLQAASLLETDGKPEGMPSLGDLVRGVSSHARDVRPAERHQPQPTLRRPSRAQSRRLDLGRAAARSSQRVSTRDEPPDWADRARAEPSGPHDRGLERRRHERATHLQWRADDASWPPLRSSVNRRESVAAWSCADDR